MHNVSYLIQLYITELRNQICIHRKTCSDHEHNNLTSAQPKYQRLRSRPPASGLSSSQRGNFDQLVGRTMQPNNYVPEKIHCQPDQMTRRRTPMY